MRRSPTRRLLLLLALALGGVLALTPPAPSGAQEEDGSTEDERSDILALIAPRRGETIADVGSGTGTWTMPLARAVGPSGRVLAVDIDPDAVAAVRERAAEEGLENVETILSVADDPMLPPDSLDVVFLNNVIDWVERRALAGFLAGIHRALKMDGRLVIRDPSGDPDRVIAELYRAGFALVEAKIPLEGAPARSFGTGWYALKLRRSKVQPSVLPRLGHPSRFRVRLLLAEELFRMGLIDREALRAKWERIHDAAVPYDGFVDEARDLVAAARAVEVLRPEEADAILAGLDAESEGGDGAGAGR